MVIRLLLITALAIVICGCNSVSFGPYTAPRVVGRVVDTETSEPVAGVQVLRGVKNRPRPGSLKGGEWLMEKVPALTDRNGLFELSSIRALTIVRPAGWEYVRLTFEKPGYERLQTNYPGELATNVVALEPTIDTGEVRLVKKSPARK